jgi:hypothetical protein
MRSPMLKYWHIELRLWGLLSAAVISFIALILLAIKHADPMIAILAISGMGSVTGFFIYGIQPLEHD